MVLYFEVLKCHKFDTEVGVTLSHYKHMVRVGDNDSFNMNWSKSEVPCHRGSYIDRAFMRIFKDEFQNLCDFWMWRFLICNIIPLLVADQFKLSFVLSWFRFWHCNQLRIYLKIGEPFSNVCCIHVAKTVFTTDLLRLCAS